MRWLALGMVYRARGNGWPCTSLAFRRRVEGAPCRADFQYRVMHNEGRKSEPTNYERQTQMKSFWFGLARFFSSFFWPFSKVIFSQCRRWSDSIEVFSFSYWICSISVKLRCVFWLLPVCTQGSAFVSPMSVRPSLWPCVRVIAQANAQCLLRWNW